MNKHIKIGTRGSKLALWQAYLIESLLQAGGFTTELDIIETKGDKILDVSLSKIGSKGLFTEELEDKLRSGEIDIAVHSAKDVQSQLDEDLELIAFTDREIVNDVLVGNDKSFTLASGKPLVVGTSSVRRRAMLQYYYPHIKMVDMRGNLQTRLKKLEDGHCDVLLLAFAGVHRMEYDDRIIEMLDLKEFTPAVGQGSVAVESAVALDAEKKEAIRKLVNHEPTSVCLLAERALLKKLQGGCSIPVFGLSYLKEGNQYLDCGVAGLDGQTMLRHEAIRLAGETAEEFGEKAALKLIEMGALEVLSALRKK
jgi:hydroxymethylbilane synthase